MRQSVPWTWSLFPLLLVASLSPANAGEDPSASLRFGVEMARKGNWREALYRFERAVQLDGSNGRAANNVAVAHEVLGNRAEAKTWYEKALSLSPAESGISDNVARASRIWNKPGEPASMKWKPDASASRKDKSKDAIELEVSLTRPPRLDLSAAKSVLVASFLSEESDLLDANREIVRFIRGEFRKSSSLTVLDVTPPPAVPEQTLEDMAANSEFWKHLGHEYQADVVVSGLIRFGRRDASGFQDVDVISEDTGQKVRQTRFVEQEQFTLEIDLLFFRGDSGEVLYKDRLRREAVFAGLSNDPITGFFQLSESIAADVRAVAAPRAVTDVRVVFRR